MAQNSNNSIFGMSVEEFLNKDILELMGAKNMPAEEKGKLIKKMVDSIQMRVIARIDDALKTDANRDSFKKILTTGDNAQINKFLVSQGIDAEKLMLEEAITYKTELVALSKGQ
ncbi:MAG: hypothetical protein M1338_00370 [Patescibacteria group bacterium]|nr:hypothetical protein [Patescibacteria group bacterium]